MKIFVSRLLILFSAFCVNGVKFTHKNIIKKFIKNTYSETSSSEREAVLQWVCGYLTHSKAAELSEAFHTQIFRGKQDKEDCGGGDEGFAIGWNECWAEF